MIGDWTGTVNAIRYNEVGKGTYIIDTGLAPPRTVIAKDGEYKGQKVEINKPLPLKVPFCSEFTRKGEPRLSCMNAIIYDIGGKGRLTIYKEFGTHMFIEKGKAPAVIKKVVGRVPTAVEVAEKESELLQKPGGEQMEVMEAGMFGGGNTMLIMLGLGFIALIGGIMFFTKKRKKGKKVEVAYAK